MANPNPQQQDQRFKGVRERGYPTSMELADPQDFIRFGKKVNYENKLTHDQVLEAHLQQIRQNKNDGQVKKDIKLQKEQDFLQ